MGAASSSKQRQFTYSYTDEPHATRRRLILKKYPQIKQLMGYDPAFKWQVIGLVLIQLSSLYLLRNTHNFWKLITLAYFVGGVANHAIMLAIHEISHGMAFGTGQPLANKIMAIFANLPIGLPMSISFRKYHLDHHRYQGDELLDTDVPTHFEAALFKNPQRKLIWCILQPFFYTLRPLFVNPKPLEKLELANIIVQISFDLLVVCTLGWHVLAYMVGGSILAMGLHPVAGHFISEHTLLFQDQKSQKKDNCDDNNNTNINHKNINELKSDKTISDLETTTTKTLTTTTTTTVSARASTNDNLASTVDADGKFLVPETCSYYGPLNWVTFNVGYHVEHHDFPSIPGSRLHRLQEIAPEFYLNLNYHTSWTHVLWQYITDPQVSPAARVRRPHAYKKPEIHQE